MDGEISEKVVKGTSVVGALTRVIKEKNVFMEVKRHLKNFFPTNTAIWIRDVDVNISYLSGACGILRWDGMKALMRDMTQVHVKVEKVWNGGMGKKEHCDMV